MDERVQALADHVLLLLRRRGCQSRSRKGLVGRRGSLKAKEIFHTKTADVTTMNAACDCHHTCVSCMYDGISQMA